MPYIEKDGPMMLKPVSWSPHTFPDGAQAVRFNFENRDGDKVDGTFSFLKKDGSPNENIELFSNALEAGKSLMCEVKQGKPKTNGGHFYSVKWAITDKPGAAAEASTSYKELRDYMAKAKAEKPAAPDDDSAYPSSEIPF